MIILGLNAYHGDSSACLLKDGELIAAAEEERFRRIKHWSGFPSEAISYCLLEANISLEDVDHIAVNRDPRANLRKKFLFALMNRPNHKLLFDRIKNSRKWSAIKNEVRRTFPDVDFFGNIHYVEHHLAHLASTFLVSPHLESIVVSVSSSVMLLSKALGITKILERGKCRRSASASKGVKACTCPICVKIGWLMSLQ